MSKNYRVGIVGYGVVGRAVHRLFKDDVSAIYDPIFNNDVGFVQMEHMNSDLILSKEGFVDLDMVVISVPTNEAEDWSADTSLVESSLEWVSKYNPNVILIKSTVPPKKLVDLQGKYDNIVFSPEFAGESKYFTPEWKYPHPQKMESHTWQVFGGFPKYTSLCVDIFKRRMGVDTEFWQTNIETASLAKYLENSFFAMKVTFVNEWYDIAQTFGVDWNELRELWLLDPRINRNHTLVFPRDRGYGGKCFPKDTRAIMRACVDEGYEPRLMKAMDEVNQEMRGKCVA